MKIEALHDFHDATFSQGWADRFEPTSERVRLFSTMLEVIKTQSQSIEPILELGIGPGYLAKYLLEQLPQVQYEGLDYSQAMLNIAIQRTSDYQDRIQFTQADLVKEDWTKKVKRVPQVIVSTWALHDLFNKENIFSVYQWAYQLLPQGGVLLNGDFIKPALTKFEYEGGRLSPNEHLELLHKAGFEKVDCVDYFDTNVEQPTTANNYACFRAVKIG